MPPPIGKGENGASAVAEGWRAPFSAAVGGATGAYVCFPFEALKKNVAKRSGDWVEDASSKCVV